MPPFEREPPDPEPPAPADPDPPFASESGRRFRLRLRFLFRLRFWPPAEPPGEPPADPLSDLAGWAPVLSFCSAMERPAYGVRRDAVCERTASSYTST